MKPATWIARAIVLGTLVGLVLPADILASTTNAFGSNEVVAQADKIRDFLFGPAMRVAGVMGGAYGAYLSIINSSPKPLMMWGGIGLGIGLLPSFVDKVYSVSSVLIP